VDLTGIVTAVVVGLIIGVLGRLVAPGRQSIPLWLTLVVGVVAALIGTSLASVVRVADTPGIDWVELIVQVGLAAVGVCRLWLACTTGGGVVTTEMVAAAQR